MQGNYKLTDGNVIVADAEFITENYPDAVLVNEASPPAPKIKTPLTKSEILRRVSASEWNSLESATDPYSRYLLAVFNNATIVDRNDPQVILWFESLERLEHIAVGRASEILS